MIALGKVNGKHMTIRLTDGTELELLSCNQECDAKTNDNLLICELTKGYEFNEISDILKKENISEILTVFDDNRTVAFQSKDYNRVLSVTHDVFTDTITIKFKN